MREDEYRSLDPQGLLPLYEYSDPRADELECPGDDIRYSGAVRSTTDVAEAKRMLSDGSVVFRGGISIPLTDHSIVTAYFWELRDDLTDRQSPVILRFHS